MKAIAIDCALSRLIVSAKNDDKICSAVYDIGMKQSETLVPAIDYVLSKVGLEKNELDYTALTVGPGSFTGLRLGISALKAIECAFSVPVYGISSLETYAYPFNSFEIPVLSCIDANKDRFYARLSDNDTVILEDGDWDIPKISESLCCFDEIIIAGTDSKKLQNILKDSNPKLKIKVLNTPVVNTEALFEIAEKRIAASIPPLKDFDGPVYLRASEAELKLEK